MTFNILCKCQKYKKVFVYLEVVTVISHLASQKCQYIFVIQTKYLENYCIIVSF